MKMNNKAIHDYTLPIEQYNDLTFGDCVVLWIEDNIWSEKIRCFSLSAIYMSAFRVDRYKTQERYLEDIHIMMSDYQDVLDGYYSTILMRLSEVECMENGKQAVRDFWENLEPDLREKFRAAREYGEAGIRTMLADKLLEKSGQ